MADAPTEQVLQLLNQRGALRPRDLEAFGYSPNTLWWLYHTGRAERVARGLYVPLLADTTEHHSLVEASLRIPHGVVCLLSALRFHELTTQNPHEVWMAVERGTRKPREPRLPLRLMTFSGEAFAAGIETHTIESTGVRVYTPAKTVADCFKYRNKLGLDVALEALRDVWRGRRATMDDLVHYARICRVANVMRPYLESLV
jgi:predicted transcriptional regulator of viral defense system